MCELDDGAGELDAGRAAADDDEGEQRLAGLGIGLELGFLERQQQPAPHRRRVLQRFETGRIRLPVVMAEIGMLRAGAEHQIVERHVGAVAKMHDVARRYRRR